MDSVLRRSAGGVRDRTGFVRKTKRQIERKGDQVMPWVEIKLEDVTIGAEADTAQETIWLFRQTLKSFRSAAPVLKDLISTHPEKPKGEEEGD